MNLQLNLKEAKDITSGGFASAATCGLLTLCYSLSLTNSQTAQLAMVYIMVFRSYLFLQALSQIGSLVQASVACISNKECGTILRPGSECLNGFCTNPFHYGGCLKAILPNWQKTRVCSSDDPPEAASMGHCRLSSWEYMEMRVLAQDWETSFFETWILQIILSKSMLVEHLALYDCASSNRVRNVCFRPRRNTRRAGFG